MKKSLLFWVLFLALAVSTVQAKDKKTNELQKKSEMVERYGNFPGGTTYPLPFDALNQSNNIPTISTGYYYYDNTEEKFDKGDIWFPEVKINTDKNFQPSLWTRILPGPRIVDESFWAISEKGKYFFRNPADMLDDDIFDRAGGSIDTTTNAIAGPMPIGINGGFYFNGLRYDSFYVSQTGIIALTNRRYTYDRSNGERLVPSGQTNCYDVFSQDWFVGEDRARQDNNGLNDPTADDFGYMCSVLGRDPNVSYPNPVDDPYFNYTAGLRSFGRADISDILGANWADESAKPALVAPFWGNVNLSQFNAKYSRYEDYGKVLFKTTENDDKLIVAFENVSLYGRINNLPLDANNTYDIPKDSRPGVPGYIEMDAKVIFDKLDSSITIVYERLHKDDVNMQARNEYDAGDIIRANTTAGVFGWARTTNFDSKDNTSEVKPGDPNYPWHSEYKQYTHYFARNTSIDNRFPRQETVVKFKQWKNTVRAVNLAFRVRDLKQDLSDPDLGFMDTPINGTDFEILAGEPLIGAMQPVGVVQNLTNDIQGPNGVNFAKQDFQFQTMLEITNIISGRQATRIEVPVSSKCMQLDGDWELCNGKGSNKVRLVKTISADDELGYSVDATYTGAEFKAGGFTGVPSYGFAQIAYTPFEPNELIETNLGRMNCRLVAIPNNVHGESLGDQWPFDDTLNKRFFVMRRINELSDDVSEFHVESTTGWSVPSVLKWVAKDAYVVDGDEVSMHALPPRGAFNMSLLKNNAFEPDSMIIMNSPVIELNRTRRVVGLIREAEPTKIHDYSMKIGRLSEAKGMGGDELSSYPLRLAYEEEGDTVYCYNTLITFSVQRGKRLNPGYLQNYSRFIGEQCFVGPEAKIYGNPYPQIQTDVQQPHHTGFAAGAGNHNKDNAPDMLVLEYAKPSSDGVNGICNIPEENWRHLPYGRGGEEATEDMSVLTIYGGGGYLRGFLESDPDYVLRYPGELSESYYGSLDRTDYNKYFLFDEGLDLDYKKFVVQIPDTFVHWENLGAKNFRFRFKVLAKDHSETESVPDDYDDFFIDNINVIFDQDTIDAQKGIDLEDRDNINPLDLECTSVRTTTPYTVIPATQATAIPIIVKIANNSDIPAAIFEVRTRVFRDGDFNKQTMRPFDNKKPVYCRNITIPNLLGGNELEINMPEWNARKTHQLVDSNSVNNINTNKYIMVSNIIYENNDLVPANDTTYFETEITLGDIYAYDPIGEVVTSTGVPWEAMDTLQFPRSDVDQEIGLNTPGRGLNIRGYNNEGRTGGAIPEMEERVGDGIVQNVRSGKFAVRFQVLATDTIRGYQAFFTSLNSGDNYIEFEVLKGGSIDKPAQIPGDWEGDAVPGTKLFARRGTNAKTGKFELDKYVTYELEKPVQLEVGTYWITIMQMETDGLNLGATSARMGMKTTYFFQHANTGNWADAGISMFLDKNLREFNRGRYENKTLFAYVNANRSNEWQKFNANGGGIIGYAHTNHEGRSMKDGQSRTFMNGTWLPLLRPYFGQGTFGSANGSEREYQPCRDTIPVELTTFDGKARANAIELTWATASETNNAGFEVQKRLNGETEWATIAFVRGNGNKKSQSYYSYDDSEVKAGEIYQYKLRQLDQDGTVGCNTSEIVTVKYEVIADLHLAQNTPNPFSGATSIAYSISTDENVKLEIVDMFGNVVKVLEDSYKSAGSYSKVWFGDDSQDRKVASGNYIYRLTVGDEVRTAKMSLIK